MGEALMTILEQVMAEEEDGEPVAPAVAAGPTTRRASAAKTKAAAAGPGTRTRARARTGGVHDAGPGRRGHRPDRPAVAGRRQTVRPPEQQAEAIRTVVFAAHVATAVGLESEFEPDGYRLFLERFARDAGVAGDPLGEVLAQQVALAHFRVGDLHGRAAAAGEAEAAGAYTAATARLRGEVRKSVTALRAYRDARPPGDDPRTERDSRPEGRGERAGRREEPGQGAGGPAGPAGPGPAGPGRPGQAPGRRAEEPAVGARDRAADRGGQGPGRRERAGPAGR